jgi:hypothetical protein
MRKTLTQNGLGSKFRSASRGNAAKATTSGPCKSTSGHTPKRIVREGSVGRDQAYVTHAALLRLALRKHCRGIHAEPVFQLCSPERNFWVFKATVYKSSRCRGFVGYGDANPGNVSPLIFNHAEMRMAETRAVNRALRKAYGIGLCSIEELPPWRLSPQQIPELRRSLESRPPFQKGATHAHQNPRSQSDNGPKSSSRRTVPRPGRSPRARRPRR